MAPAPLMETSQAPLPGVKSTLGMKPPPASSRPLSRVNAAPPGSSRFAVVSKTGGSRLRTPSTRVLVSSRPSGVTKVIWSSLSPTAVAWTGRLTCTRPPSETSTDSGVPSLSMTSPLPLLVSATSICPDGPSTWASSNRMRERSPGARKRGIAAEITTGSRTSTSSAAWPTPSADQAMAMTRTLPLKSGRSKSTVARP